MQNKTKTKKSGARIKRGFHSFIIPVRGEKKKKKKHQITQSRGRTAV
jgi:hypothetical protein